MKKYIYIAILAVFVFLPAEAFPQHIHYVNIDATGSNDGSSWVNAYTSLQDALTAAVTGDEIWVAAGEYYPDHGSGLSPGDRSHSFELKSGVRLHGGFDGSEATRAARDLAANRVVLSGDLSQDDDGFARRSDNSYHVVRASSVDSGTLLDGFTIIGGHAKGTAADSLGGGIFIDGGSPWIVNTRVNSSAARCGGGVAIIGGASTTLVNVVANGNQASTGGGVCLLESDADITNATVSANTARTAAGIYNYASSPSIKNSVVSGNRHWDFASPCQVGQFPCSGNDVSPEALVADAEVRNGVVAALESGTLEDAIEYVQQSANVVETYSGPISVGWRVSGGGLSVLMDGTDIPVDVAGLGKKQSDNGRSIIGEDWNSDGYYDNHDGKRALILSPFGFPDADLSRQALLLTPGYQGNVISKYPDELSEDTESTEWMEWSDYDFIYLSTLIDSVCREDTPDQCFATLLTAVETSTDIPSDRLVREIWLPSRGVITVRGFSGEFTSDGFAELDNAIVHCSLCINYLNPADEERITIPTNFGQWATPSSDDVSYPDMVDFNQELMLNWAVGMPAQKRSFNGDLYTYYPQSDSDSEERYRRIMELPILMYDPDPEEDYATTLVDLTDITDMIIGTIDDNENDQMVVRQLVYGVDPQNVGEFELRIELNGLQPTGSYPRDLTTSSPTAASEHIYDYREVVDLGFPIESGIYPFESIVELPDGTDSRYVALVSINAFSCSSKNLFDGYRVGSFTGAANWNGLDGDAPALDATLTIESAARVLGSGPEQGLLFGPSSYNVQFALSDRVYNPNPPNPGAWTYTVDYATLNSSNAGDVWFSAYTPDDSQCPDCMASVQVDSVSSETVYGKYQLIGKDITGTTSNPNMTIVEGKFVAVPGSRTDTSTRYFGCLDEYWTAYEERVDN